jgi:uncharacterized protein
MWRALGENIMNTVDRILGTIAQNKEQLRAEFGVIGIGIFGSVVREQQNAGSDIDIFVKFERPIGFVRFMRLEKRLAELLGMPVDLVTKKALKPHIGRRILQEVRYV